MKKYQTGSVKLDSQEASEYVLVSKEAIRQLIIDMKMESHKRASEQAQVLNRPLDEYWNKNDKNIDFHITGGQTKQAEKSLQMIEMFFEEAVKEMN